MTNPAAGDIWAHQFNRLLGILYTKYLGAQFNYRDTRVRIRVDTLILHTWAPSSGSYCDGAWVPGEGGNTALSIAGNPQ